MENQKQIYKSSTEQYSRTPNHPDHATKMESLDLDATKTGQLEVNREFAGITDRQMADLEATGKYIVRAYEKGEDPDKVQPQKEYTSEVGDSPYEAAASERAKAINDEVGNATKALAAVSSANPDGFSPSKPASIDDLKGFLETSAIPVYDEDK